MKKILFVVVALCALAACNPTVKPAEKCTDPVELQEAILKGSVDTAKFDLNGDGVVNISDLNYLQRDSVKVKKDSISAKVS